MKRKMIFTILVAVCLAVIAYVARHQIFCEPAYSSQLDAAWGWQCPVWVP